MLVFSQGEANIWYFGQNAGIDFNSGSPVALTNGQLVTDEGCATISKEINCYAFQKTNQHPSTFCSLNGFV